MFSGKSQLLLFLRFAPTEMGILYFCRNYDLQARWFGFCLGFATAFFLFIPAYFIIQKKKRKGLLAAISGAGFLAGQLLDAVYFAVFSQFPERFFLILFIFQLFQIFRFFRYGPIFQTTDSAWNAAVRDSLPAPPGFQTARRRDAVFGALVSGSLVFFMATPNFILHKRELPEGVYVYANDVSNNIPIANIFAVRLNVLTHTGLCLVTKDPEKFNRLRRESGKTAWKFEKLDAGYWIRDFNLNIKNYDGFANYGSATNLDDRSFQFDLDGWNHYLAGRSTNDRLRPAIRIRRLPIQNPAQAWERVENFKDKINAQYPLGFIYSPIPYQGHFVRFYNCNSLIAGVADKILNCGKEAEKMTAKPFQIGRQTLDDGNALLNDYESRDFAENIKKEREFMNMQPLSKQKWIHILLNRSN